MVHFDGPTTDAWYDALDASGVRIVWYQPQYASSCTAPTRELARAAAGPGVRAVTP